MMALQEMRGMHKCRRILIRTVVAACLIFGPGVAHGQEDGATLLKAFPGAEGYGACTPGGRGGKILLVTTLEDYVPGTQPPIEGSLRAAVDTDGPRYILFRVSGTIALKADLVIAKPFATIAGQTAPGDGICVRDYQLVLSTHDAVIRHVRIRSGSATQKEQMAVGIFGGANSILDHCSMSWAIDEVMSSFGARNITVQWSIIAEGLSKSYHPKGEHSKGSILAGDGGISLHHSIYAHNAARNPRVHGIVLDFRNNVVYNWGYRCGYTREAPCFINYINNYFKPGPSTGAKQRTNLFAPGDEMARMFFEGNVLEGFLEETQDNRRMVSIPKTVEKKDFLDRVLVTTAFPCPPLTTDSTHVAMERVLQDCGATRPRRDKIDLLLMDDIRLGTGKIIDSQDEVGGWPVLESHAPEPDQDNDGMPDAWEAKYALSFEEPGDAHGDPDADGYPNIEEYVNETDPRVAETDCRVHADAFRQSQQEALALAAKGAADYEAYLERRRQQREERKKEIVASLKVTLTPAPGPDAVNVAVDLGGIALLELVRIPAGSFTMGSPESEEGQEKERPQHKVNISKSFYMAATPTTAIQFKTVMGAEVRPNDTTPDEHPAKETTWFEATEFCEILSAITGCRFRLPTEAEWEYACRAGTATAFYTGDTITTEQANFNGLEATRYNPAGVFRGKEMPVKTFPANPWGLFDMPGNQGEYCQDFAYRKYTAEEVTDPIGTTDQEGRVLRGGKAGSKAWYVRSASRYAYAPQIGYGFRVVMETK